MNANLYKNEGDQPFETGRTPSQEFSVNTLQLDLFIFV